MPRSVPSLAPCSTRVLTSPEVRRRPAFFVALALATASAGPIACGGSEAREVRDTGEPIVTPAPRAASSSPAGASSSSGSSGSAALVPGSALRLFVRLDPAYRACASDAECQVLDDCACTQCLATRALHVEPCPTTCSGSPCARQRPACRAGVCVGAPAVEVPSAATIEAARAAGQRVLDDPRFTSHLHADVRPERLPMTIAWDPTVPRPAWRVGGEPARFEDGFPKGPHLAPMIVDVRADAARFELTYEPEGLRVAAELTRAGDTWSITQMRVTER